MNFLKKTPIRRKVTLVILLTSTVVLLIATISLFAFQLATFKRTFERDAKALSEIIASQCNVSLSFDSEKDANEILNALEAKTDVLAAWIVRTNGTLFAKYGTPLVDPGIEPQAEPEGRFVGDYLVEMRPVWSNSEMIGTVFLVSEYRKAYSRIIRFHLGVLAAVLVGSILLTLALSSRLQRVISDPILKLADTARSIAERKDYSARALKVGDDELGLFTDAFNQMLGQIESQDEALQKARRELEQRVVALQHEVAERERAEKRLEVAHRELLEASRQAGMAEVATGVLHNVGNVLNSVNVSTTLLRDSVRKSEVTSVQRLAGLLQERADDLGAFLSSDPKGRMVPQFLSSLGEQLAEERINMLNELELLYRNVEHIKDIVSMQQNYARVAGVVERVSIESLVEDALQIHEAAMARHGVTIERRFESVPLITADKHKILQIIVNLIHNAKYAVQESVKPEKLLTVFIQAHEGRSVRVIVQDNGIGIPKENLTRIFSHGFTTRRKGHGFGLHSSALAAQEIGGQLKVHSDGVNCGAVFTLDIPLRKNDIPGDTNDRQPE